MQGRDVLVSLLGFSALWLVRNVVMTSLWWVLWLFVCGSTALYYL